MKVGSVGEGLHVEGKQELNDILLNMAFGNKIFWVYTFPGNK
jgi:hypothetical protein